MYDIGYVTLKVTSIRLTYVTLEALKLIGTKTEKYRQTNTSVEIIKFTASVSMGPHICNTTSSFLNEIIIWVQAMFRGVRCIDAEEDKFVEPKDLRRVVVTEMTLRQLPHLLIICINSLVIYKRINSIIESLMQLGEGKVRENCMHYDIIKIYTTPNSKCLEIISYERMKKHINKDPLIPNKSIAIFEALHNANNKNTIAAKLDYSNAEFNRYYA